jgi:hypothetical protein
MNESRLAPSLYVGEVFHERFTPAFGFRQELAMALLDLEDIASATKKSVLFSEHAMAPVTFRRRDYVGDPSVALHEAVRDEVERQIGFRPVGRVLLLTNLRTWGWVANPISIYWCYDDDRLVAQVLEVTNTPWHQKHCYVVDRRASTTAMVQFQKELHVSPFFPMDFMYEFTSEGPTDIVNIELSLLRDGERFFEARLYASRVPLSTGQLVRLLFLLPTQRVSFGIYYRALRLWKRGATYVPHPLRSERALDRS